MWFYIAIAAVVLFLLAGIAVMQAERQAKRDAESIRQHKYTIDKLKAADTALREHYDRVFTDAFKEQEKTREKHEQAIQSMHSDYNECIKEREWIIVATTNRTYNEWRKDLDEARRQHAQEGTLAALVDRIKAQKVA